MVKNKSQRKLKVYGGTTFSKGKQINAVVAAPNMKELAKVLNTTLYYVREMWCETGNEQDIKKALRKPMTIVVETDNRKRKGGRSA